MEWLHVFALAIIQGLTEFLPVSSSAHLILPSQLLEWPDQGLAFDVGVHLGTLIAVVFYFRKDVIAMLLAFLKGFRPKKTTNAADNQALHQQKIDCKVAWFIILSTIPALMFGFFLHDMIDVYARSILVIAGTTLIFGALLWFADTRKTAKKDLGYITIKDSIVIGMFQAIALIPGTSRSGATMSAALLLGFSREAAAKFSFFLSIPVILAASCYKGLELLNSDIVVQWAMVLTGIFLSAAVAITCIHLFLIWLEKIGMLPFVIYRFILGSFLLMLHFNQGI